MISFKEILSFVWKLVHSCLFAGIFFILLVWGKFITTFGLHFYDFLLISIIVVQILFIVFKFETLGELKIILIYHVLGFVMEVFKTYPGIGAWSYPDSGFFTLLGVPLYSGFMYSAVWSFIFKAWNNLDLKFTNFPKFRYTIPIAFLIYLNFFTHHFLLDFRYLLIVFVILIAWNTFAWVKMKDVYRKLHVLLWLFFIGFFLWIAENIATYFGAWVYPNQAIWRNPVSLHKILSWFLLFIVSIVVVSAYKMNFGKSRGKYNFKKTV